MIIVSACLLRIPCRYDGTCIEHRLSAILDRLEVKGRVVGICPEVLGGLPIPRESAEIIEQAIRTRGGDDLSAAFQTGVERALDSIASLPGPELFLLKSRSPSCGVHTIYDGSFQGRLIGGQGWLTRALRERYPEVPLYDETELEAVEAYLLEAGLLPC